MSISGVSGYKFNTNARISGLASNMDTDALVQQAMKADTAKYTKILQKRQVSEWRAEAYREVTSSLQSFYKEYFDPLSSKNLKSTNSFASFAASYSSTTSTDFVSVTPRSNATAGTYSITAMKAATTAKISTGISVSKAVEGAQLTDLVDISSAKGNNNFTFTLNGISKQFTLKDSTGTSTVNDYVADIQKGLDDAFGINRVIVDTSSGSLKFSVKNTDTFKLERTYFSGAEDIFSAKPTSDDPLSLSTSSNKFDLTIAGITKTVTLPVTDGLGNTIKYSDANQLAAALKTAADSAFGGTANITFSGASGKVTYTSSDTISITETESDAYSALGFDLNNLSNKVNLTDKLSDVTAGLNSDPIDPAVTDTENIQFRINGTYFRFNSKNVSINDIIKAVNSSTAANANLKYDSTTNSFKLESKGTGLAAKLDVEDVKGNFLSAVGVEGAGTPVYGSDASVTVNGVTIVRPTNSFTYDGLTYDIKKDFTAGTDNSTTPATVTDPIKVTVTSDTTKTYDFIKTFVDKYNEIIDKLNDKISEKVYKDFQPLTDEQEADMSEEQIKKWNEKAKSGLLKNDSIITSTLSQFRSALYAAVEGADITLSSIGITTSSNYEDKGKLIIDETKLKGALASKPEEVSKLFTNSSDVTYFSSINSSKLRTQRYKESGLANRFSDIIQDAIRTNTDSSGKKGSLLEKAGIVGDRSEVNSLLSKEILRFDSEAYEMNQKLIAKEKALYKKYAAMESALNKLNEQSNQLASYFST